MSEMDKAVTQSGYTDASRGAQALVTSAVCTAFAGLFMVLRLVTRIGIVKNWGPEDWLITIAFICSVGLTAAIGIEVQYGEGRHVSTLSGYDIEKILQALYGSIIVYQLGLVLIKGSILCQYHRVFVGKGIRLSIYIMGAITVAYGAFSIFANVFMCTPIPRYWNKTIDGKCISQLNVWFANAAINIATDIAIFLLPMPALKQLQLPNRQKYGLMGVFALGGFVCLVSILRLRALYVISVSTDVTWDNGPAAYWSSVELNVGVICATLPTLKAFMSRFFPKILGASSRNEQSSNRRTGTVGGGKSTRMTKNATVTEIEMSKGFGYPDTMALDPKQIQVVTVVEQEREDVSEGDKESVSDRGVGAGPAATGYIDFHGESPRPASKGHDMV